MLFVPGVIAGRSSVLTWKGYCRFFFFFHQLLFKICPIHITATELQFYRLLISLFNWSQLNWLTDSDFNWSHLSPLWDAYLNTILPICSSDQYFGIDEKREWEMEFKDNAYSFFFILSLSQTPERLLEWGKLCMFLLNRNLKYN